MSIRYILVSGGGGGIGSALCRLLPANEFIPIVGYRSDPEHAESIARACNGFALRLDMGNDQSIADALDQLKSRIRGEDKLAGAVLAASPPPELLPFGKLTPEMLMRQFRVNVAGPQLLLAGLIKDHFRKDKSGVVVGVLSAATGSSTRPPATGMGAYVIAKTAMRGMLDVCAAEYPWLRVHTISPGFTETPMLKVFDERYLEQMRTKSSFSTSEEVARTILRELTA